MGLSQDCLKSVNRVTYNGIRVRWIQDVPNPKEGKKQVFKREVRTV